MALSWYLIHSKPRQEKVALDHLERQGYPCYLPVLRLQKIRRGAVAVMEEALFPRYLFVQLDTDSSARSWTPIHSTRGVSRLVRFGSEPARVDEALIACLREQQVLHEEVKRLFEPGQRVQVTEGAFAGIEGVFQMQDGQARALVLIELLSRQVQLPVSPGQLRALS